MTVEKDAPKPTELAKASDSAEARQNTEGMMLDLLKGHEGSTVDIEGCPSDALFRAPPHLYGREFFVSAELALERRDDGRQTFRIIGGTVLQFDANSVEVGADQRPKNSNELALHRVRFPLGDIVSIEFQQSEQP